MEAVRILSTRDLTPDLISDLGDEYSWDPNHAPGPLRLDHTYMSSFIPTRAKLEKHICLFCQKDDLEAITELQEAGFPLSPPAGIS